jgi:hypothetical protein
MSNSHQTYNKALEHMELADKLRRQSRYMYLMTARKSTLSIATELYDLAYTERVGDYDDDDHIITIFKREIVIAILRKMLNNTKAQDIDYYHIVMEMERSFWGGEIWKNKPEYLIENMRDKLTAGKDASFLCIYNGFKSFEDIRKVFKKYGEIEAYNHMIKLVFN